MGQLRFAVDTIAFQDSDQEFIFEVMNDLGPLIGDIFQQSSKFLSHWRTSLVQIQANCEVKNAAIDIFGSIGSELLLCVRNRLTEFRT